MVFCIESEKNKELSRIISEISKLLIEDKDVEALIMNSYLIHIPYSELFMPSPLIDGINIKMFIVAKDDMKDYAEVLDHLRATCLERLNYNILFSVIYTGALRRDNDAIRMMLNDGEILFDKDGKSTSIKNMTFKEKSLNVIEYEPKLNIRKC